MAKIIIMQPWINEIGMCENVRKAVNTNLRDLSHQHIFRMLRALYVADNTLTKP